MQQRYKDKIEWERLKQDMKDNPDKYPDRGSFESLLEKQRKEEEAWNAKVAEHEAIREKLRKEVSVEREEMRKHGDLKILIRLQKGYPGLDTPFWACYLDMVDHMCRSHIYPKKEEDKETGQPFYYQEYHHQLYDEAFEYAYNRYKDDEEGLKQAKEALQYAREM